MKQADLFEEAPAQTTRVVITCPACRCCHSVDGKCLGECEVNGHRLIVTGKGKNRKEFAGPGGGWVDLEYALSLPYPEDAEETA